MSLARDIQTPDSKGVSNPDPSPDLFIDTLMGYQKTAGVKAAVQLGFFGAIADGANTAARIAAATGSDERGAAILCDYLVVLGFLHKAGDLYSLTPSSAVFLDPGSPAFFGGVVDFLASPEFIRLVLDDPAAYVRNGGAIGLANLAPDNPVWVVFAKAMVPLSLPGAKAVAARVAALPNPPRKVLDVSAGHGYFGIEIAKALPEAEVVGVDWRSVLDVAESNAAAAGVGARYRGVVGSAFDVDWGQDFDLVMVPGFLHHFNQAGGAVLLEKARRSLSPQGRVLATEFIVDEDRLSPPWPAAFSFLMLATTPTGHAYSARQVADLARAAGFAGVDIEPLPPSPHSILWFR